MSVRIDWRIIALVAIVSTLIGVVGVNSLSNRSSPIVTSAQTTSSTCDQIYQNYQGLKAHATGYLVQFSTVGDASEFQNLLDPRNAYSRSGFLYYGTIETPIGVGFDYHGNPDNVQALWFSDNGIATIYVCS